MCTTTMFDSVMKINVPIAFLSKAVMTIAVLIGCVYFAIRWSYRHESRDVRELINKAMKGEVVGFVLGSDNRRRRIVCHDPSMVSYLFANGDVALGVPSFRYDSFPSHRIRLYDKEADKYWIADIDINEGIFYVGQYSSSIPDKKRPMYEVPLNKPFPAWLTRLKSLLDYQGYYPGYDSAGDVLTLESDGSVSVRYDLSLAAGDDRGVRIDEFGY